VAEHAEQIFNELSQICAQYKTEVPSSRRAWPESVKSRVFALKSMGISFVKIAEKTGIAYQTITAWGRPSSFFPVKVVDAPLPTVTVSKSPRGRRRSKFTTVTVITPTGYRIEGLDSKSAIEFIAKLEAE
jgi:hypothetical protein